MSVLSMLSRTHLSSDSVVGHDIKQLVKNLKPRQVAARQHKSGWLAAPTTQHNDQSYHHQGLSCSDIWGLHLILFFVIRIWRPVSSFVLIRPEQ